MSEEEEMRRTLFAIAAFLVMFTIASLCEAGGEVKTKKSKGITISGEIKLDTVFADREANTVIYGLTGGKRQQSAIFSDPTITLNFDVWLAQHVNAFMSVKTPEYIPDDFGTPGLSRIFEIDQAYVDIDEFGYEDLSFKLGIYEIAYDFLGNDNPFFLAIGRCEDAFTNNFQPLGSGELELNGPGLASTIEAGGVAFSYKKKKKHMQFRGDMLFVTTVETRQTNQDREMFALVGSFAFPREKAYDAKVMITLANISQKPSSRIWTLGVSSAFKMSPGLELFAEAYGQTGIYWNNYDPLLDPPNISSQADDITHEAFGGYGGFKYTAPKSPWKWHFGLEWWWLSGDPDRDDGKQQSFVSYEDVDDTIILEENNYGYDLDTNYSAVKMRFGFKPHKDWEFNLLYGSFRTARTIRWQSAARRGYDNIGDELDLQFKWDYTEDVMFRAGIAFLRNAKFFKPVMDKVRLHELLFFEAVLRF